MQVTMNRSERSLLILDWDFHSLNRCDNIKPLYGMYQRESSLAVGNEHIILGLWLHYHYMPLKCHETPIPAEALQFLD